MYSSLCRHSEADLDKWGSTDNKCAWKNRVKEVQREISQPIPLKRFCHGITTSENEQSPFVPIARDEFETSQEYALIISGNV